MLYPGLQIVLEVENPVTKEKENHRCRVADLANQKILIDYPVNAITNRTAYLMNDTNITVRFVEPVLFSAIYKFETKVTGRVNKEIPMLILEDPGPNMYRRLQRRQFVRVQATVDIMIELENCQSIKAVTVDISTGGMLAVLPFSPDMQPGQTKGVVTLFISTKQEETQPLLIPVKLLRLVKNDRTGSFLASFQFTGMNAHAEKTLTRFCFERQLAQRKKEVASIRT